MASTADLFLNRETMHCVFSSNTHTGTEGKKLYALAEDRAKELLLEQELISVDNLHKYLLSDFPKKAVHKISLDIEDERGIPVIRDGCQNPSSLLEESILLNSLKDNEIAIKRLYVSSEYREIIESQLSPYL